MSSLVVRLILGPILVVLGVLMMKYSVGLTNIVGKIGFAERIFQPPLAGTYTWWKLLGLALIVISLFWMFGYLSFTNLTPVV
ncbi:MAG TPA: hypothetical protein VEA59_05440 [Patescibacteria group bacterium]|nr:hypothetical protein [Patescibacteria group bacterium]